MSYHDGFCPVTEVAIECGERKEKDNESDDSDSTDVFDARVGLDGDGNYGEGAEEGR